MKKVRHTLPYTALALALSLLLTGCVASASVPASGGTASGSEISSSGAASNGEEETAASTRIFTDSLGRAVEIPAEIGSVAVTGQLGQIVMLSIAPDLLVGISNAWDASAAEYLPEEYYTLPVLGQLYGGKGEISLEELLILSPDIVIDIGESSSDVGTELDALQVRTGLPFVHIESTLATTPELYATLGALLGRQQEAQALSDYCSAVYTDTEALLATIGDDRAQLVYCLGEDGTNVIGAGSYHSELIEMVAENIALLENPSSKGTGDTVGFEQLLLWNPDIILFAPGSVYSEVADSALWNQLSAVQNNSYYEVPSGPYNWLGMPPSIQRYLGLLWLNEILYPQATDTDLQAAVTEYYALFYHCDLTDTQYDALMEHAL